MENKYTKHKPIFRYIEKRLVVIRWKARSIHPVLLWVEPLKISTLLLSLGLVEII